MSRLTSFLTGAAMAAAPVGAASQSYGNYQTPPYSVAESFGTVEIRDYGAHILAEVSVRGERRAALGQGFRILAGYIFGGNTTRDRIDMTAPVAQSQRIDMTAPVTQSQDNAGVWTVTFMMPRDWTLDTLPTPNATEIRLREVPPARRAAVRFSGRATDRALKQAEATLRDTLRAQGLAATGAATFQFFDDPTTLPWNRRNEVTVKIDHPDG